MNELRITDFRLVMAPDWNNGKPGGKERWVVFDNTSKDDESHPVVCETLKQALHIIRTWAKPEKGKTS
jgi:hypothetical protein